MSRDTNIYRYSGVSDLVAFTTNTQSAAVPSNIHVIRVTCDAAAWINIGDNPTATVGDNSIYMAAGVVDYFVVTPGQKVAVIQAAAGGNMSVGFMTR
jgi:hypothetical protein